MAERTPLLVALAEKVFGRKKTVFLKAIQTPLEELKSPQEDFSILYTFLRQRDRRQINNIELRVRAASHQTAELTLRETKTNPSGLCEVHLDEVYQQDGVIRIGERGMIAFRGLDEDGRPIFSMAVAPDIDVHSRNRPDRIHKPKVA